MVEGIYVLLNTDRNLYASLFDFVEPWKIDILDYLNENYMCDLSLRKSPVTRDAAWLPSSGTLPKSAT